MRGVQGAGMRGSGQSGQGYPAGNQGGYPNQGNQGYPAGNQGGYSQGNQGYPENGGNSGWDGSATDWSDAPTMGEGGTFGQQVGSVPGQGPNQGAGSPNNLGGTNSSPDGEKRKSSKFYALIIGCIAVVIILILLFFSGIISKKSNSRVVSDSNGKTGVVQVDEGNKGDEGVLKKAGEAVGDKAGDAARNSQESIEKNLGGRLGGDLGKDGQGNDSRGNDSRGNDSRGNENANQQKSGGTMKKLPDGAKAVEGGEKVSGALGGEVVSEPKLGDVVNLNALVVGKKVLLVDGNYIYSLDLKVPQGEEGVLDLKYFCSAKAYKSINSGDIVTAGLQEDGKGNISILTLQK